MDPLTEHEHPAGRRAVPLALAAALALYAWLVAHFRFVCDDAYISFRYARHLAEGAGLRFNPAESPPVEGYSNLLWVLWLAPFERLGVDVRLAAVWTSAVCGAILIALAVRLARRRLGLYGGPLVASALVLASLPPFVLWATGGLETMACTLALFAAFERLTLDPERPRFVAAGACGAAAVLLRADGALWLAMVGAAALVGAPREHRARTLRAVLATGAIAALALVGQLAFRLSYHHEWIPNTARVKTGLSSLRLERGLRYLASLLLELPALALVPLAASLWRPARTRSALAAAVVVLCAGAYAVFVGGDFMAMGRFVVPAMPFVALCFGALAAALWRVRHGGALLALATALVVGSSLLAAFDRAPVSDALRQRVHFRWNEQRARSEARQWLDMRTRADEWARIGRALALHSEPGEAIVLPNLGAISYYTEVHAYDPFGLVCPEVARLDRRERRASPGHDKGVPPSYFYARRPDYLGAWIVPAGAPLGAGLTPGYEGSPLAQVTRIERYPLPPGDDFRPGEELRVLRLVLPD
ncbi:MAG TPA: hypothetical protein VMT18_02105 [Planctomycetota bacterium]|nr:hypothetical protein [Planctomycetota bacterium]